MRSQYRMMTLILAGLLCLVTSEINAQETAIPQELMHYADLVVYNAKLYTMDDRSTNPTPGRIAQAMAVQDRKILAVGNDQEILRYAGPKTMRIDAHGRVVIPGIIDGHSYIHVNALAHHVPETYFAPLALLMSYTDTHGQATAPEEPIDRVSLLKAVTSWAADFILKANELGTLERGNGADFVVLNKDYFNVPQEEILSVAPVMIVLGGKPAFLQADFAAEIGESPVHPSANVPKADPYAAPAKAAPGGR